MCQFRYSVFYNTYSKFINLYTITTFTELKLEKCSLFKIYFISLSYDIKITYNCIMLIL